MYLGRLFGLLSANAVAKVGKVNAVRRQAIRWAGDNTCALSLAETGQAYIQVRSNGECCRQVGPVYSECAVDSTEHLAGAQMGDIDGAACHKVLTL